MRVNGERKRNFLLWGCIFVLIFVRRAWTSSGIR